MGIRERRERERQRRREAIVDAAERIFFERGIESATMDDVAVAAELSKGTLYLYFRNKADLYLAVVVRGMAILRQMFERASVAHERGVDKIEAIGRAYFEFSKRYPDYFNAMLHFESTAPVGGETLDGTRECERQSADLMELCARAIRAGTEDGSIRADVHPMKTALTLYGLSTGLLQIIAIKGRQIKEQHDINPDELVATFFDLIENSLRGYGRASGPSAEGRTLDEDPGGSS